MFEEAEDLYQLSEQASSCNRLSLNNKVAMHPRGSILEEESLKSSQGEDPLVGNYKSSYL